jgi:lipopolysaccharide heptosyltransferase II
MGWAKRVIAISNVIARHMVDDFDVPYDRVKLIPRSVDVKRYKYISPDTKRKEEFHIGIIGRITPLKGHLHFIKAAAKVARLFPRIKIWIVGDAPASKELYKDQVQVLVRRLGLWHCTEFLGTQRDIPSVLASLDLVVLATTTHEAFGRVIIEAQAAGVPVVATQVGGVVDIIEDGKNGLLVPPEDPQAMSEAILKIIRDPQLARSLSEAARKKVEEKFNIELMVNSTLDVYKDALSNFKILIIKFGSIGDVILSTAALRAIRQHFGSGYKISLLVGEASKDVLIRSPFIDELLVSDFKNKDKGWRALFTIGRLLRKKNFDLVIDLQNNRKSHILSFLSWSTKRYGYNKKFGFLLNHTVKDDKTPLDPLVHQFRILKLLGIDLLDNRLEMWPAKEDASYVGELLNSEWLSDNQRVVGINLAASSRWMTKGWPKEHLIKLCEELGLKDIRVILTGVKDDFPLANELINAVKSTKLINLCGKTNINQLACVIKRCNVYISADSSPLHIANAMQTPFVALFGPTDHRRHLPAAKKFVLLDQELKCSPCYKPKCRNKKCMWLISPEEVLEAVDKLIE